MTKATIGSVSTGTLRDQDLLRAFADTLDSLLQPDMPDESFLVCDARNQADILDGENLFGVLLDEAEIHAGDVISDLEDALQEFAPPYCRFGAHEGDGADFGFWPCVDSLENDAFSCPACPTFDVLKVNDTADAPSYVLHVNDHGNVTLYRIELVEEWGLV